MRKIRPSLWFGNAARLTSYGSIADHGFSGYET